MKWKIQWKRENLLMERMRSVKLKDSMSPASKSSAIHSSIVTCHFNLVHNSNIMLCRFLLTLERRSGAECNGDTLVKMASRPFITINN